MNTIQVVAAVLRDRVGRVLVAERPVGKPLAGYWEFPGGKLESGEPEADALKRELREELGIEVQAAYRLLGFSYLYPERRVQLHVWRVTRYAGTPAAHEGQRLAWHAPEGFAKVDLLPADAPILAALKLPPLMLVTPPPDDDEAIFLHGLERSLAAGVDLVQFRAPGLEANRHARLAERVVKACRNHGARVVLNGKPALARDLKADGVHLRQDALDRVKRIDLDRGGLVGISCHSAEEMARALEYRPDYLTLGTVKSTVTHPGVIALGWERFATLAAASPVPVYAIGGLGRDDLATAHRHGGYGVAAIRALWDLHQLSDLS